MLIYVLSLKNIIMKTLKACYLTKINLDKGEVWIERLRVIPELLSR